MNGKVIAISHRLKLEIRKSGGIYYLIDRDRDKDHQVADVQDSCEAIKASYNRLADYKNTKNGGNNGTSISSKPDEADKLQK